MIDDEHADISISRQCDLFDRYRPARYYKNKPLKIIEKDKDKLLIFEEYLECPSYGYLMITEQEK